MLNVHILDRCPYCDGKAYLPIGEATNWKGEPYTRYEPCRVCEGTGECGRRVSLPDFLKMLRNAQCKHEHTACRGGTHFSAGEVWGDIEEVCDGCGANLDHQTLAVQDDD